MQWKNIKIVSKSTLKQILFIKLKIWSIDWAMIKKAKGFLLYKQIEKLLKINDIYENLMHWNFWLNNEIIIYLFYLSEQIDRICK